MAEAELIVDLDAIAWNHARLRAEAGGRPVAAVVKADAYGLGAERVAARLHEEGCGHFFVARLGEALALRAHLPLVTIHVLEGVAEEQTEAFVEAGLRPVLNTPGEIELWAEAGRRLGRRLPAAIHLDTGMCRLGLSRAEVSGLEKDRLRAIDLTLVMSHLACAEDRAHPMNARQLALFIELAGMLPPAPRSLANASGIFLGPAYHFDLVRPGAALYGINPTPGAPNPMRAVVRIEAKVIQTADCTSGTGIGYGHDFHAERSMRLATISLGYADGWPRRAGGAAFHAGARLPFVGRVSMDSIVVDVSALPAGALHPGDLVEVIGESQTVDDVALLAGTIGYEILTGLGRRFHRRWIG